MKRVETVAGGDLQIHLAESHHPMREGSCPMTKRKTARSTSVFQLKITLKNIRPPIWRRVLVPADMPLDELHGVIQVAMGWVDGHLHAFSVDQGMAERVFSRPEFELDSEFEDERRFTVGQVLPQAGTKMLYEYDFGDGWDHDLLLEKILPHDPKVDLPLCLKGKRACPPEDCGGPWGYADLLEVLADPKHERHADLREWLGRDHDPEAFNIDEVNQVFRQGDHLHTSLILDDMDSSAEVIPVHPGGEGELRDGPLSEGTVWMGGSLQHTHSTPEDEPCPCSLAFTLWVENHLGTPQILAAEALDLEETSEAPIVAGLRVARAHAKEFQRPEPIALVVPSEENQQALLASGEKLPVIVDPLCATVLSEILEGMHRHETAKRPLNLVAAVPGELGVTEKIARDLYRALASFFDAHPWTGLEVTDAFRLTLPGQPPKIIHVMGASQMEYGVVGFESLEDLRTLHDLESPLTTPEEMRPSLPSMLGFSFDWKEVCHPHLEDHLRWCHCQWLDKERRPVITKIVGSEGFVPCSAEEFEELTVLATVMARLARILRKERAWPPQPGFMREVPITLKRNSPMAQVELLNALV
jgi:Plasmid pRiA4b ORF-3-like protein